MKPPRHFNPFPRFGLRLPACRECGMSLDVNPIVHLGNGVLAKLGLCEFCLAQEMGEREREYFGWTADVCAFPGQQSTCSFPLCTCSHASTWAL